ncbi:Ig-like domain-containing protein [Gemmatimonas sp.]|uniref:Ig-like domain-containing protein n=1 Tax=Gemmatimonas sp. TaxID=1962908 RepID=UPI003DA310A4
MRWMLWVCVLVLCACGGGDSGTEPRVVPLLTRIEMTVAATVISSGVSTSATVRGFDQTGAQMAIAPTFASSDPTIARVDASGVITGARAGQATISAAAGARFATSSIAVIAGAPVALALERPAAGAINGGAFTTQPRVAVVDAIGNVVTADNSSVVTLSIPTAAGTIGTLSQTVSAGLATFVAAGLRGPLGSSQTLTFRSGNLREVSQQLAVLPFSFANGTRLIGSGVPAGTYRSTNPPDALCYWARLRNLTGVQDIIANDVGGGPRLLQILPSDLAVQSSGCAPWTEVVGAVTSSPTSPFADGVFLVGTDVQSGTWQSSGTGTACYWARLRNVNGTQDIIANNFGASPAIVTILPTDVAFESGGCGTWTRIP